MKRFYNMEYSDAVLYLTGGGMEKLCKRPEQKQDYPELALPERNGNMRRVFAYLTKQRRIDRGVVEAFAHHGMIYESAKHHNVVYPLTEAEKALLLTKMENYCQHCWGQSLEEVRGEYLSEQQPSQEMQL